ncbi:MAG: exo-alpha-sialidase [Chloroflexi bacterium]|nr:exo-alpha-sialidase [Chloroflexota bacterium]
MARRVVVLLAILLAVALSANTATAAPREPGEKSPPPLSGFYDFWNADSEFETGIGNVSKLDCTVSASTQPSTYAGDSLIDCDGEVPHNETAIVVDPNDPDHAVGGYHSYNRIPSGATVITRILGTTSVTFDEGTTWREVAPPIAPYQFSGDPALAFDANGRVYFANIADHEGQGIFTNPSVIVTFSDDGGLSYSSPVTVASGEHAITSPRGVFQDKEYIAADSSQSSPFRNRVYVTWSSFQWSFVGQQTYDRSPITVSYSDNGRDWSEPKEISGSHPNCTVQFGGGLANECDEDQFSSPTVAPNGRVYVAYENFNTPRENQYMVVSSSDGGATWSRPVRVDTIFDFPHYPRDPITGRFILSGCQFRVNSAGNLVADPNDPSGKTLYLAWSDNRNGTADRTNVDVLLARSTDAGVTWKVYTVDKAPNDQFYPWAAVGPDGAVNVGYMDRSYSSGQDVCQYGFSVTTVKFGTNGRIESKSKQRVDTGLSDPGHSRWFSGATGAQSLFIGDYNGVAAGSDGGVWSLWTDQRNVVADPPSPTRNHGQHAVVGYTRKD